MKVTTAEGQQGYQNAVLWGGVKGVAIAASLAVPAYFLLSRKSATYRALPPPLKAFGFVVLTVPAISISAEKAGEAFERSEWFGRGKVELDREEEAENARWEALSMGEKLSDFGVRHQYGIVGASWAASMVVAFGMVARNPYQTLPQKIVQARVWAQGLTVAVLIGSAVLAGTNSQGEKPALPEDHSWRTILGRSSHVRDFAGSL
ncbi:hypothetical protein P7C73_g4021, partial [Tremellales sp. Uapishka_1]